MKTLILLTAVALVSASAQSGNLKQSPVAAKPAAGLPIPADAPALPLAALKTLEKELDGRIASTGGTDPCIVQDPTRGVYVSGMGAVFTAQVELAATSGGVGLFPGTSVGPEQKAKVRKNKLAHVALIEQTMRDMVLSLAASPTLKLADNEQVVVSVRLWYQRWEDTTGMPGQITVRLDHKGGTVKTEVQ